MRGFYPNRDKLPGLRARIQLRSLLEMWYGDVRGVREACSHDGGLRRAGDLMQEQLKGLCRGEAADFMELSSRFAELAGRQMAVIVSPERLGDGVLYLKVRHSAFLGEELNKSADLLIERINGEMGRTVCRSIRFI